jgi:predicted dehydrogenase
MTKTRRVAVIGLGHWYSAYGLARALPEYPAATLVAAASPESQKLDAFTSTFRVPGYLDYRELLEREQVDVVHIATPVSEMADVCIAAAQAGKHMVLGKPMAMTVAEADRMVEAVERAGVTCFPFQAIGRLRIADLVQRIRGGEIGDVKVIHQTCRWSIAEDWYQSGKPGWFADPRFVPGGAFIDEGIYWVDFFRYLTGSEIVQVEGRMANLVHTDIAVEDWGQATFTFANGIIATLEASWTINSPRKSGPSPKQNAVVRLEVVGSRGELMDQSFRSPGRAVLAAGAADWTFERQPEGPGFAPPAPFPLSHLIDCLDQNRPPVASIREARDAFVAAMAAYESARLGKAVTLGSATAIERPDD